MTDNIEVPEWLKNARPWRCGDCFWWRAGLPEWDGLGECLGGPPSTAPKWDEQDGPAPNYRPRTRASNWCGAFRMKEPSE